MDISKKELTVLPPAGAPRSITTIWYDPEIKATVSTIAQLHKLHDEEAELWRHLTLRKISRANVLLIVYLTLAVGFAAIGVFSPLVIGVLIAGGHYLVVRHKIKTIRTARIDLIADLRAAHYGPFMIVDSREWYTLDTALQGNGGGYTLRHILEDPALHAAALPHITHYLVTTTVDRRSLNLGVSTPSHDNPKLAYIQSEAATAAARIADAVKRLEPQDN